jgi:hypothetical protein
VLACALVARRELFDVSVSVIGSRRTVAITLAGSGWTVAEAGGRIMASVWWPPVARGYLQVIDMDEVSAPAGGPRRPRGHGRRGGGHRAGGSRGMRGDRAVRAGVRGGRCPRARAAPHRGCGPGDAAGTAVVPRQPRLRPVHAPRVQDARDGLGHETPHRQRAPALAAYAPEPGGGHRLHTLQVFTITGGRVAHNVVFADPPVFEAFDLPKQISFEEFRRVR